jgi:DNA-binding transcriptional LysR family regulator
MYLTHLEYFRAVVEHGSLTAAARALGVSQPTLSGAVRRLESRFDTTLLTRSGRGVKATASGDILFEEAGRILQTLNRLDARISDLEQDDVGQFDVGCYDSLGAYFLPGFIKGFMADAPRINIHLVNARSADVRQMVVERRIHFGVVVNPEPHPDLVMVELFDDAVDVIAAERAPTLKAAHEVIRESVVMMADRVPQSDTILQRLAYDDVRPARVQRCGELELVKSLTLGGVGIGILPRRVAAYGGHAGLFRLHPDLPYVPDVIMLLYHVDLHRTRAAMRVKDALLRYGRSLRDDPSQY